MRYMHGKSVTEWLLWLIADKLLPGDLGKHYISKTLMTEYKKGKYIDELMLMIVKRDLSLCETQAISNYLLMLNTVLSIVQT